MSNGHEGILLADGADDKPDWTCRQAPLSIIYKKIVLGLIPLLAPLPTEAAGHDGVAAVAGLFREALNQFLAIG